MNQNSKVQEIFTGYLPREHQELLHRSLKRFNVIVCHRRFGKTVFSINEMVDQGLRNPKRKPQYAYISPTYGQSKRIAWEMLKDYTKDIPGATSNEQDLRVDIPRPHMDDHIRIMLLGAENPGTIRGIYLDGVVLDEFAEMHPDVWTQVVRPALSDRKGWAIFVGTPRGYNHFYDVWKSSEKDQQNWFRAMFKASETKILPQDELEAAKITMSEEEYEQEYECSFGAALIGSYYGKQITKAENDKRLLPLIQYDRAVPVATYWDLGIGDTTAIWCVQQVGKEYHIINHVENSGVGLDWYVKKLKEFDYIYSEHVLPHDAAARDLGSGKTRVETLQGYGLGRIKVLERHDVDDGIHAVRMIFDFCWFDEVKCKRGLDALRAYEKKWDAKNKIMSAKPLHNWASHSADAFRTFAMGCRGLERRNRGENLPRMSESDYDIFDYTRQ